jgi:aspartyl-tRNA(Asn)/glutamyl-tRNA(Gln) amidotransferase subunit C
MELQKILSMAQLKLDDSERISIEKSMNDIFSWVTGIAKIDTTNVEPLYNPLSGKIPFNAREDVVVKTATVEQILSNAPYERDNFFIVPKVIES